MIIPKNWNEIEAKETGDFMSLSLGGHVCKILNVKEHTNEITGNVSLKVSVDIDEDNEYKDYFKKIYDKNTLSERKWPSGASRYISLKEEQMPRFKGFITAVNNSNNVKLNVVEGKELDLAQFTGKKIVAVFGLKEYQNDKGEIKTTVYLADFRSIDKLSEIKIPKVQLIGENNYMDYEEYQKSKTNKPKTTEMPTITDEMLPF